MEPPYTFVISKTFARGLYSLIVSDLLRCLYGDGFGGQDEVSWWVGWGCERKEKGIQRGMCAVCGYW